MKFKILFLNLFILQFFIISCHTLSIDCDYNSKWTYQIVGSVYRCEVKNNLNITSKENLIVNKIAGSHKTNYDNNDVRAFDVRNKILNYLPQNIENIFNKLYVIQVNYCQLKHINQTDLKPFVDLKVLDLEGNELWILENGLFTSNTNLKFLSLARNKIIHIDSLVLFKLSSLNYFNFVSNQCSNLGPTYDLTSTQDLLKKIHDACFNTRYYSGNSRIEKIQKDFNELTIKKFKKFSKQLKDLEKIFMSSEYFHFLSLNERLNAIKNNKKFIMFENLDYIETRVKSLETDDMYFNALMLKVKLHDFNDTIVANIEDKISEIDLKLCQFSDKMTIWVSDMENSIEVLKNNTQKSKINPEWDRKFGFFDKRISKKIGRMFLNSEKRLIKMVHDI